MFGQSAHANGKTIVVVDVDSGGVGVGIVRLERGAPAEIVHAEYAALPSKEHNTKVVLNAFISLIGDTINKASAAYASGASKGYGRPQAAFAVVNEPLAHSRTVTIEKQFKESARISDDILEKLAQQALLNDTELDHSDIIEASVVRVELNGYPTSQPVGKFAEEMKITALLSDGDARVCGAIKESILRAFGVKTAMRSRLRALSVILREMPDEAQDVCIIDTAGSVTNLIVMHDGMVTAHATIPEGTSTLLKRIAGESLPDEARSLLRMINRDECSSATCDTVNAAIARAESALVRIFGEKMAQIAAKEPLPTTCVLNTDEDLAPWLSRFFARIDFTQFTMTTQPFSVITLDGARLSPWVRVREDSEDAGLTLATALMNIENNTR